MAHRLLYLVRHGQYQLRNREDGELTSIGEEQARLTADALRPLPFHTIHTSTVRRAIQTAEIICESFPGMEMQHNDLLRECLPTVPTRFAGLFAMHRNHTTPDEMNSCSEKMDQAFAHFFTAPGTEDVYELFICHGNLIRYFVASVLKAGTDIWANMLINNCGISRVLIDQNGEMFLVSHNDIGHLPEHLRTDN
jgi:serine/threonine-protein phosphatase PGAM5